MNIIQAKDIEDNIARLFLDICCNVDKTTADRLIHAEQEEGCPLAKFSLNIMNENIRIARDENIPACQDTGMAVVFLEIGRNVYVDGNIDEAVNNGVRRAYRDYFRKSVLDPLTRINTGDNTPAIIHYEIVEGDTLKISVMAKGFGSENMSRLYMLTPAEGKEGIIKKVVETVVESGGCACPPVVVGVGIGGTMEKAAYLAKKALLRDINIPHSDNNISDLEGIILDRINNDGEGAQGLGGNNTALTVLIETFPTHIAGLPVAINIQCHINRHRSVVLGGN